MFGELVAFPTDTVYGIGCDPWNVDAIMRLYAAKERDTTKGIPILLADIPDLQKAAPRSRDAAAFIDHYWPCHSPLWCHVTHFYQIFSPPMRILLCVYPPIPSPAKLSAGQAGPLLPLVPTAPGSHLPSPAKWLGMPCPDEWPLL